MNSIPVGLQSLLAKLDFIGQIRGGSKACMSNMTFVDDDSWIGSFYRRFWVKESRKTVISDIEKIINETIESIKVHKDTVFLKLIINSLSEARIGIDSMKVTYRDDPNIKSRISVQLKNIDIQLEMHRHLIKGYQTGPKVVKDMKIHKNDKDDFPQKKLFRKPKPVNEN